jgi:transposase-like protein
MAVRIAGKRMHLWRAVDDEGEVLDVLVQRRRDKHAARKLMRELLRKQGFAPTDTTTDGLRFRTSRCGGENGRCSGSSRPAPPSASSPCTPSFTTPSTHNGT